MSTQATPLLSPLYVDFHELYARHLGRHSQFGINVGHLVALYGLWFGVYAAIYQGLLRSGIASGWVVIVGMAVTYLAFVAINAPFAITVATAVFMALFVASVLALPPLPAWSIPAFLVMVPIFYKFQAWNHKVWNVAADMTEFNKRFPPGPTLSWILLIYEVPICLNYLIFRRPDWRR